MHVINLLLTHTATARRALEADNRRDREQADESTQRDGAPARLVMPLISLIVALVMRSSE